jgi:hypothetical protein
MQFPPKLRERLRKSGKYLWVAVTAAIAVFGTMAGAYSLRPQLNVSASASLDKENPFSPITTIVNSGLTEIFDLTFSCYILEQRMADIELLNPRLQMENRQDKQVGNNIQPQATLRPTESIARTCAIKNTMVGSHIVSAAVTLRIDYRPRFWFGRLSKFARFKSRGDASGGIQWIPDPKDDPFDHQ